MMVARSTERGEDERVRFPIFLVINKLVQVWVSVGSVVCSIKSRSQKGYEHQACLKPADKTNHKNTMTDSGRVELSKDGTPLDWNSTNWAYFKAIMLAKFGENASMLAIVTEKTNLDASWSDAEKTAFAQIQAKIYCLLLESLSMAFANRFLERKLGFDAWKDVVGRYEGVADPQRNSLEVKKLLAKLHNSKGHHGSMEAHLTSMFQIRDRLAILKHLV
ncbi:hypothetical protein PybrP1_012539 [[Pythium] brassicae (nom. inval.)]|nr:hypothetical protein PybrP1_012539 [[Pythium] brassicae (nom. inval.)]